MKMSVTNLGRNVYLELREVVGLEMHTYALSAMSVDNSTQGTSRDRKGRDPRIGPWSPPVCGQCWETV